MRNNLSCRQSLSISSGDTGADGQKLSKCNCPNGWLFCSHTLAIFVLFYAIQLTEEQWSFKDLKAFMPVPIKSLQSVPFAASYVFDELEVSKSGGKRGVSKQKQKKKEEENYISIIAKGLAKDVPRYSGKYTINEEGATNENQLIQEHAARSAGIKSIDLCA